MSLNKYIRSKTVRDYYDEIGYEISPMVALWVVLCQDLAQVKMSDLTY